MKPHSTRRHSNGQTVKIPIADHVKLPTAENVGKNSEFPSVFIWFSFSVLTTENDVLLFIFKVNCSKMPSIIVNTAVG